MFVTSSCWSDLGAELVQKSFASPNVYSEVVIAEKSAWLEVEAGLDLKQSALDYFVAAFAAVDLIGCFPQKYQFFMFLNFAAIKKVLT